VLPGIKSRHALLGGKTLQRWRGYASATATPVRGSMRGARAETSPGSAWEAHSPG
jgi:hypothetical protein